MYVYIYIFICYLGDTLRDSIRISSDSHYFYNYCNYYCWLMIDWGGLTSFIWFLQWCRFPIAVVLYRTLTHTLFLLLLLLLLQKDNRCELCMTAKNWTNCQQCITVVGLVPGCTACAVVQRAAISRDWHIKQKIMELFKKKERSHNYDAGPQPAADNVWRMQVVHYLRHNQSVSSAWWIVWMNDRWMIDEW